MFCYVLPLACCVLCAFLPCVCRTSALPWCCGLCGVPRAALLAPFNHLNHLQAIAGQMPVMAGTRKLGEGVKMAVFSQDLAQVGERYVS